MAKVDIVRMFLAKGLQGMPPTPEGVDKYIRNITFDMNFSISKKERAKLVKEFAPAKKKHPKEGVKSD